jgi:hypothetical protein
MAFDPNAPTDPNAVFQSAPQASAPQPPRQNDGIEGFLQRLLGTY